MMRPRVPARPEVDPGGGQFSSRTDGGDDRVASDTRGAPASDGKQRERTRGDGRRPRRQHPGQVSAGGGQQATPTAGLRRGGQGRAAAGTGAGAGGSDAGAGLATAAAIAAGPAITTRPTVTTR